MKKSRLCSIAALCLCAGLLLGAVPGGADAAPAMARAAEAAARVRAPEPPPRPEPVYRNTFAQNKEEADALLDGIAARYGVMGYSAAVFEHERVVYTHSGGIRRFDSSVVENGKRRRYADVRPAEDDTIYRVASISKLGTLILAMRQVERGALGLDERLGERNPLLANGRYPDSPATVEMLLTHTSGIVDGAAWQYAVRRDPPFPPLGEMAPYGLFSSKRPGEAYSYSNLGVGLLAGILEQCTGEYFYDHARDDLFGPLGIDAAYVVEYIRSQDDVAELKQDDPLYWREEKPQYARMPKGECYLMASGGLYIRARDLARLAMILAGDGTLDGRRYLEQATLEDIHTPRVYDKTTNVTRGLVVQITDEIVDGVTLYGHQGNAYGAISCVFYDREAQRGVVFLTNGAGSERVESQVYAVNDAVVKGLWQYLVPEGAAGKDGPAAGEGPAADERPV